MNLKLRIASLLILLLPYSRARAEDLPRPAGGTIVLRRCSMDYLKSSLLGAPNFSILQDCLVQPGDRVRTDQVLGRLQDREVRAEMALRQAQAENDLEIRLNEAKHARSLIRLKASESLKQRNALSLDQWNLERLEETISGSEVENAKLRRRLAQLQLEQTKAAVRAREIVAPHEGVVVAVLKKAGEAVTPGTPIFQVVDPDHILVSGNLDVNDAFRVRPGQSVRVAPVVGGLDLAVEHNIFLGRIKFVDTVIDARTQTCKVVAEVDNREGMLRAGLTAWMEILPDETLEVRRDLGASGHTGSRPTVVPAPPSAEKSPNSVGGDPDHRGAGTDSRPAVVFPRSQARP